MNLREVRSAQMDAISSGKTIADLLPAFNPYNWKIVGDTVGEPEGVQLAWCYPYFDECSSVSGTKQGSRALHFNWPRTLASATVIGLGTELVKIETCNFSLEVQDTGKVLSKVNQPEGIATAERAQPAIPVCITVSDRTHYLLWQTPADYKRIANITLNCLRGKLPSPELTLYKPQTETSGYRLWHLAIIGIAVIAFITFLHYR